MPYFTDQLQRTIELAYPPKRIISLVPSQTELLLEWGLVEEVVGITKFCIHPAELVKGKTRIGGTKNFHFDRIEALNPDLIIANKEENYQEGIEYLQARYPVWISDIITWQDALDMITQVGKLTCQTENATKLITNIEAKYAHIKNRVGEKHPKKILYLIWREPYMAAGKETFIDAMLDISGLQNICEEQTRYPVLTHSEIQTLAPDIIFLSSEPYPFKEAHVAELQQLCPESKIRLVDGEMFSWYGSRLLKSLDYCTNLIQYL